MKIKQSKILVPAYLTNHIYPSILKHNKQNSTFGIKIDNVYSLLSEQDYQKQTDTEKLFEVYDILNKNKESFFVFKSIINNVSFIKQFINFYKECVYYEIDIDKLPEDNDEEKEIKVIIKLIDSLNLNIRNNYEHFKKTVKEYEIMNDFYSNFLEYKLLDKAIEDGCKKYDSSFLFCDKTNKLVTNKQTTRNKELDYICKYILKNNDKTIQVVCPKNIYLDDIARVFNAYQIPFRRINYKRESVIVNKIIDFVELLKDKDNKSLLQVLRSNNKYNDLCDYIEHFKIEVNELLKPFDRFSKIDYESINNLEDKINQETDYEKRKELIDLKNEILDSYRLFDVIDYNKIKPLILLEINAEKQREELLDKFEKWLSDDYYLCILEFYNELVNEIDWKIFNNDLAAFSQAGRLIKQANNFKADLGVLIELLKEIKMSDEKDDGDILMITDTEHLLADRDITIVIGANEGVFLPSLEKNEIIKEDYVSKIAKYPSLKQRLNFSKLKMECLSKISPEIVISYCYSDYSGKEHKLSSYIENTFKVSEKDFKEDKDNNEFNYYKDIDKTITKENAKALFVKKDNGISGSVTSLETYSNCPYSYFLQRGLGINNLEGYQQVDAAVLGTLRHKIFEILGENNFIEVDKLDELLDGYMDLLKEIYSNDKDELIIKQKMIGDIMKLNIIIAQQLNNSDDFSCTRQEYRLDNQRVDADDYHFNFTAIVDRIDEDNDYYRVIDYKSSSHGFKPKLFASGKQLQLMVYLWLLWKKEIIKKDPLGAFYFNLNLESDYANKLDKIIDAFNDEQKEKELFIDKNKLQGWYIPDSDKRKQLNLSKLIKSANVDREIEYDLNSMEGIDEFLNQFFIDIAKNITEGKMEAKPDTETCRYCNFSSICHKQEFGTENQESENQ